MKIKRATHPEYREDERKKVLTRMTKARTINRKNGLNQRGKQFTNEIQFTVLWTLFKRNENHR
jgi:hypothetical protein